MIIEVSMLRWVLEYLEDNNVDFVIVEMFFDRVNFKSIDENNGAGVNIYECVPYIDTDDLPF